MIALEIILLVFLLSHRQGVYWISNTIDCQVWVHKNSLHVDIVLDNNGNYVFVWPYTLNIDKDYA